MAATLLRDVWTHNRATDAPKTLEEIAGDLRFWLGRYRELPEDAQARKTLQPGYQDRIGAQDVIATRADLARLLTALSDRQREAVARCCIGGQSAGAAGRAMNLSRTAVRRLVTTGLQDAAKMLRG